MKSIITTFFAFSTITLFAQNIQNTAQTAIRLMPHLGQGYLVLGKEVQPNINYWQVTITERTYATATSYSEQVVETHTLPTKQNYLKIPLQYRTAKGTVRYFMQVVGYSKTNIKLWEEPATAIAVGAPPIDFACPSCTPYSPTCKWTCNGTTYAWDIQQYLHPSGGNSHYTLETAYDYFDNIQQKAIPYYQYMSKTVFYSSCVDCYIDGIDIMQVYHDGSASYFNAQGSPISAGQWVVGVGKGLGPWRDGFVSTTNGQPILSGIADCGNTRSWAINIMNTYADFSNNVGNSDLPDPLDSLACLPDLWNSANITNSDIDNNNPLCLLAAIDFVICNPLDTTDFECDGTFNDMMDQLDECYTDAGYVGGFTPQGEPISIIDRVVFTDLSTGWGVNPPHWVSVKYDDKKHEIGQLPQLEKSLYTVGIVHKDGLYLPLVKEFEVAAQKPKERERASFLEAKIIPVPVVDNRFDMKLKAEEHLKFHYELFDGYGNKLHERDFMMDKNEEKIVDVNPGQIIPNGLLMHRFTFMDGSIKGIETIRN